ncbi:MAG: AAA family ATPase [Streptosporangiaceae bacterium]
MLGAYRLVTLTGPGGAGKTRLAVEAARAELDATCDGVWLVELAPVSDPAEVPSAVLSALGLREQTLISASRPLGGWQPGEEQADTLGRLVSALAGRQALLVLDNCEHLVAAAAALADRVLGACPQVRILATSREPLNITGEALWAVGPLTLPPDPAATAMTAERAAWPAPRNATAGLEEYASVRLFTQRARAVFPGFGVTPANAPAVARICRALDGMPLAIELAAARMRAMTPEQVAARLDDRFQLLSSGSRTAMPRHQTLRAVVDWSWELLDDAERMLWRRFSVFAGGATLEAAVQVCAGPGSGGLSSAQVEDLVTALADKSLLTVRRGPDGVRYRMLEIIRAYGAERLEGAGEAEALRQAHGRYFLQLAEDSEKHLRAAEQLDWLRRLADDQDNLRAALRGAVAAGDARTAVGLAASLGWYSSLRSMKIEGSELMAEAVGMPGADDLAGSGPRDIERLGLACVMGALLSIDTPLRDLGAAWFARAAELAPRITDPVTPLMPLIAPFSALFGSFQAGHGIIRPDVFDEAIADADPWVNAMAQSLRAHTTLNLGQNRDQAEADFRAAAAVLAELGERWAQAVALSGLAMLEGWQGEHAASVEHYRQAAEFTAALGSVEDEVHFRLFMARELWLLGERDRAGDELARAERDAERIGLPEVLALAAYTAGDLARLEGDPERARPALLRAVDLGGPADISQQIRATAATGLGYLAAQDGDLDTARRWHAQALEVALTASDAPVIANAMIGFADLALREDDPESAAELIGATSGIRGAPDRSAVDEDRVTEQARSALGDTRFGTAHQRGQRVTLDTLAAWSRSHLALEGPHRQRREHDGEADGPQQ